MGQILAGKRSRYTHLVISVNGAHESYDRVKAKIGIIVTGGPATVAVKEEKKEEAAEEPKNIQTETAVLKVQSAYQTIKVNDSSVNSGNNLLKFTITSGGTANYRVTLWDKTEKGSFSIRLYSDSAYQKEISGSGNWDQHPLGGKIYFRDFTVGKGTYYLKIINNSKKGTIEIEATVNQYNKSWDNER